MLIYITVSLRYFNKLLQANLFPPSPTDYITRYIMVDLLSDELHTLIEESEDYRL